MFGKRDENGEVGPSREELTEERSFDELTRGLASGTISRGRALKLVGAAFLGGALSIFSMPGEAHAATCTRCLSKVGCNVRCIKSRHGCTADDLCNCFDQVDGENTCGYKCCGPKIARPCTKSADCGSGQFCSRVAGRCCGKPGPVCVVRCKEPRPRRGDCIGPPPPAP